MPCFVTFQESAADIWHHLFYLTLWYRGWEWVTIRCDLPRKVMVFTGCHISVTHSIVLYHWRFFCESLSCNSVTFLQFLIVFFWHHVKCNGSELTWWLCFWSNRWRRSRHPVHQVPVACSWCCSTSRTALRGCRLTTEQSRRWCTDQQLTTQHAHYAA